MKSIKQLLLAMCIIFCAMPMDLAAQNKKNGSSFLDNIYKSSQNQRRNQRSNNSISELEKLLQDAKKKSDKRKEGKKARQQTAESYDQDAFFYDYPNEGKDKKNKKSEKEDKAKGDANAKLAQDDIALVVNGEGMNKTEATKNALRSAIEQAYGTFVSASTEILNDELVKDEIATVASGNIKSYKELSSTVLPNGSSSVTLSAVVSIGKLIKYAQAHGGTAEFAGQTFLMNMRMQELNQKNEALSIEHIIAELTKLKPVLYDCSIEVGDPVKTTLYYYPNNLTKNKDEVESGYSIPLCIIIVPSDNLINWFNTLRSTLSSLSLNDTEVDALRRNGIKCFDFHLFDEDFKLRNGYDFSECVAILNSWVNDWEISVNHGEYCFIPCKNQSLGEGMVSSFVRDAPFYIRETNMRGNRNQYIGGYDLYMSRVRTSSFQAFDTEFSSGDIRAWIPIWMQDYAQGHGYTRLFFNNDFYRKIRSPYEKWSFYLTIELFFNENEIQKLNNFEVCWRY
ncbi:MAG: hypothetical protein IKH24_03880 [Bacteroidales bacterium]|nr:hypothetical protein [Bacteroidales bacterium]